MSQYEKKIDGTINYIRNKIKKEDNEITRHNFNDRVEYRKNNLLHKIVWKNGCLEYYRKGKLHNSYGPAVELNDGTVIYYDDGKIDRSEFDGPALINLNGHREYWSNNLLSRFNGPAITTKDGVEIYLINGIFHRLEDKPSIVKPNGFMAYYMNNVLHREHGPSVIHYETGLFEWWYEGKRHNEHGPAVLRKENSYKAIGINVGMQYGSEVYKRYCKDNTYDKSLELGDVVKEYWVDGIQYSEASFNEKFYKRGN